MSNKEPKLPEATTTNPTTLLAVALFGGGGRSYLRMSLLTSPGRPPRPVYHLTLMPSPDTTLPAQNMTLEDLTMLKAQIEAAIREGIAMTTMVFQDAAPAAKAEKPESVSLQPTESVPEKQGTT